MEENKVVESGEEQKGIVIKKGKRYSESQIINDFRRLRIKAIQLLITIPANAQIGIKNLGKIDFLIKKCGYVVKREERKERKNV